MKKSIVLFTIMVFGFGFSQKAFNGKGDVKSQVGASFQTNATGIMLTSDYGLGESMSAGAQIGFLLGTKNIGNLEAEVSDKLDVRVRFQANLGQVIGLPEQLDVYPGLNISLKNFGGHFGARYFFGKGFGVYSEVSFPIAKYKNESVNFDVLNNQFMFQVGASFDLQ